MAVALGLLAWAVAWIDEGGKRDDFATGIGGAPVALTHLSAGYLVPRLATYVLVIVLWFVPTIGADLSWWLTGWDRRTRRARNPSAAHAYPRRSGSSSSSLRWPSSASEPACAGS